jgi:hypothetical protein
MGLESRTHQDAVAGLGFSRCTTEVLLALDALLWGKAILMHLLSEG